MALTPVSVARALIVGGVKPLPAETLALREALGRVLAVDATAKVTQPPFEASAMDGYAVRHADVAALPATLRISGVSAAGHPFKGKVKPGTAVRILTGAAVPAGADTIVIQENVVRDGDSITVINPTALGRNIRARGLDFAKGTVLVPAGTILRARDLGLLAAGNNAMLRVRRKPRVAILTTGDELAQPGAAAKAGQIYSSNSTALAAYARQLGAEVLDLGIIRDDLSAITRAIKKAAGADVLLTTGGASVGDHDFVQAALKKAGVKIGFWKIAMRPGKPLMFGRKGAMRVIGLPGNPVAALVCARIFLKPLLCALQGLAAEEAPVTARLATPLAANDERQDYLRANLSLAEDGGLVATPASKQDSSMQRVMREAQCLVVRPPHAAAAMAGEKVPILLLNDGL